MGLLSRIFRRDEHEIIDTRYKQVIHKLEILERRISDLEKRVNQIERELLTR